MDTFFYIHIMFNEQLHKLFAPPVVVDFNTKLRRRNKAQINRYHFISVRTIYS